MINIAIVEDEKLYVSQFKEYHDMRRKVETELM